MDSSVARYRRRLLWLLAGSGCVGPGGALINGERCEDVPEVVEDEMPDGPALVCLDAPEVEGNSCPPPDQATYYLFDVLNESLGEPECGWAASVSCGPTTRELDRCCYVVDGITEDECGDVDGRPLRVSGRVSWARCARRSDWAGPSQTLAGAPGRARLAALWARAARDEHASVAAFARLSLSLMALGAPPDLLAETQRAASDEVQHARGAFALAGALAGRPVGPGPLRVAGLEICADPAALLVETLLDGCWGETLAGAEAAVAAQDAQPAFAAHLRRVAADEARHAALAWRTAVWLLRTWPGLGPVARTAMRPPAPRTPRDPLPPPILRAHGLLPAAERAALATEVWAKLAHPLAGALLAAPGTPRDGAARVV